MLPFALPDEDFQAVAVTSVNGARALSAALCGHREEETWRQRRIYAVGERTAQAAREAGFGDVVTPPDAAGVEALAGFIAKDADPHAGPLLYISGRETAGDLAGALSGQGLSVTQVTAYAANAVAGLPSQVSAALTDGTADAVLFYSARSASAFFAAAAQIQDAIMDSKVRFLCLSQSVAAMIPETVTPTRVSVAKLPEESALFDLLDTAGGHGSRA